MKGSGHGNAGVVIVSYNKSGRSLLDSFYFFMLSVACGPQTVAAHST